LGHFDYIGFGHNLNGAAIMKGYIRCHRGIHELLPA
jgi:hypothetical protein